MSGLLTDVRYVVRGLARSPGFTLVATLSLAFGIGANAATFGAITSLLRDPLPVERPEELTIAYWRSDAEFSVNQIASSGFTDPASGASYRSNFSYPLYRVLRAASPHAQVFAFNFLRSVAITVDDQPPVIGGGLLADGSYFSTLRPGIGLGRGIIDADDRPDAPLVVVLSHGFWMRVFGGDPGALGRTIRLNGVAAEIVGVTARGFEGLSKGGFFPLTDITVPLSAQPHIAPRWGEGQSLFSTNNVFWLRVMARVPERAALTAVTRDFTAAFRVLPTPVTEAAGPPPVMLLAPGARGPQAAGSDIGRLLWILMGVVGAVLLIACVNLASLMLARGIARERETAVRRALGSGRARLIRQTLLEGLVLSVAGTIGGLVLLIATRDALGSLLSGGLGSSAFGSVAIHPKLALSLVGLSAALCGGATLLFGLLPALRLSAMDPASFLRHRSAGRSGRKLTLGRALIALQIAVSVPLLVGATLLLRTISNLNAVDLGFDPRGLVFFQLDPGFTRLAPDDYPELYAKLLRRLADIPGVASVTLAENALMSGITSNTRVNFDGRDHNLMMNAVGPGFVETMGMRLIDGRMPELRDDPDRPHVAAVNQTAVRQLFDGASPIGRVLRLGEREVHVVGVVSDSRYERQRAEVSATLYDAALQRPGWGGHHIVMRTSLPVARLEPSIRQGVAEIEPDLPVPEIRTQLAQMARTTARERVFTQLLLVFGAFALLLASIGLHGVTAYSVARRTSEIGVRIALGARPAQVLWLILRQVSVLALAGLALGVPTALIAVRVIRSLLFGVASTDVLSITIAAAVMLGVAFAAGAQPALRAARLDPLKTLRTE